MVNQGTRWLLSCVISGGCRPIHIKYACGAFPIAQSRSAQGSQSLGTVAIFADLPSETLAAIEKRCAWRKYESGEPILGHLDAGDDVFFIIAGEARVSIYSIDGKAVTFCDLGPGEMFGEYAAVDSAPRSAGIEARTQCLVASMPSSAFRNLLQSEPAVTMTLLRQAVTKIRLLTTRVYEVSALAVSNRIQAELLRLAKLAPRSGRAAHIDPAPTHVDIASRTSTHREAVTRELSRLSRIGIVERRGRTLVVHDVNRLAAMVHEATGE